MSIKFSGTTVEVPSAIPNGNTLAPINWQQLLSWEADAPMPVDLQLDVNLLTNAGGGFPEVRAINVQAGARYDAGGTFVWDDGAEGCIAVRIEMASGQGDPGRTLYADCRGGRYALGAQRWVRVSVARWLAAGTGQTISVSGSITPADGSGDYLTYSATIDAIAAAATAVMAVPPGALWWEFYPAADSSWSAVSMDSVNPWTARRYESALSPVYNPPTTPLPLLGSNGVVLTNQGGADAGVTLTFWVR